MPSWQRREPSTKVSSVAASGTNPARSWSVETDKPARWQRTWSKTRINKASKIMKIRLSIRWSECK
ncbi:MAG: hypothetical protein ACYSW3_29095 [Planctomycetota bacterium]